MDVQDLRFYGRPFSDAEGSWPRDVKRRMNKKAMMVVAGHLGIKYKRTQTLAGGGRCCDFRFERSFGGSSSA
jgi:hypothetical protein